MGLVNPTRPTQRPTRKDEHHGTTDRSSDLPRTQHGDSLVMDPNEALIGCTDMRALDDVPARCHVCGATGATGYARMARDGAPDESPPSVVVCYACADTSHRLEIARSRHGATTGAYLSSDGAHVQTWTGGALMRVLSVTRSRGIDGTESVHHVRAVAPDGAVWSGRGPGPGMYVRLRRTKAELP